MSRQRQRHIKRQSIEETIRIAIADFVGDDGDIEVERHSYDWRSDDLLVWVRLHEPVDSSALEAFRLEVATQMRLVLPDGQPFDDWLVVVECKGQKLTSVAWDEELES